MKFLSQFEDGFFDLVIDDPPFGIGPTWSKSPNDRFYKKGKGHQYQNDRAPGRRYFDLLRRKSKNQIIFGGNYFTKHLPPTNAWIVWDKVRDAERQFMSEAELAWTSLTTVTRIAKYAWNGAVKCEYVEKIHPHQKPILLYKWCLIKFAKKGYKIADLHVGSGSSRIAAYELGFDFYGCERDPHYFEAQDLRFKRAIKQQPLFTPPKAEAIQITFS